MTTLTTNALTEATLEGGGVFDVLMRANKAHLESEFIKNRIKGPEYATVYLGSLTQVLQTAVQFLLAGEKLDLEKRLLEQQILLAQVEVLKANAQVLQTQAQTDLIKQQTDNALAELAIIQANALKVPAEIAEIQAKAVLLGQQKANLTAEALNIPKQGALLDAQKAKTDKDVLLADSQIDIAEQEILVKQQQVLIAAEELRIASAKLVNIPKEGLVLDAQAAQSTAQTALIGQQKINLTAEALNIPKQGAVLDGQKCKLDAEFDLLQSTNLKTAEETQLLLWKTNTEKAQTTGTGVDENSVVGKQKALYGAQTSGFTRDAEQKVAKVMVDSWNVRRTTDEGTVADGTNMLHDVAVGRAVTKLLTGVGA